MNVMQIVKVRLKDTAENVLTAAAYREVNTWLGHWTAPANFKAVVTASESESLEVLRKELETSLVPYFLKGKVTPDQFEFEVSSQSAPDGRFWMPSSVLWACWHDVVKS